MLLYLIFNNSTAKLRYLLSIFLLCCSILHAQDIFEWNSKKEKIKVPFEHIYNLIIIPVKINDVKLNMLLDTGSENSLIFSLTEKDSVQFYNPKRISLRGLGSEKEIEALESSNNTIDISGYASKNFTLQIVLNQDVNFSSRLGIPVNGILGHSFFENNIIEINYYKKEITIHKNEAILNSKKIKKYNKFPIKVLDHRPYVKVNTQLDEKSFSNIKLLIDIGLGDGLWLFENDSIKSSKTYFEDVLGRGLSGDIHGKRSRINALQFSDFKINEPLVSYPNKSYFPKSAVISGRNGSVGGEILHRFNVILDYKGENIYLKKNPNFSKPFHYNMSGIEIEHNGIEYVSEKVAVTDKFGSTFAETQGEVAYRANNFKINFSLKPVFKIVSVRKNSPAAISGLIEGDKIIKINKKSVYKFTLQKIIDLFQSEEGKWIYLDIERNGTPIAYKFQLKKII